MQLLLLLFGAFVNWPISSYLLPGRAKLVLWLAVPSMLLFGRQKGHLGCKNSVLLGLDWPNL